MPLSLDMRGENKQGKVQRNTGWTNTDKHTIAQLTFHEAGRSQEGWFEVKIAPLLREGKVGDFGEPKKLTFDQLNELIDLAKGVNSSKVMFSAKGNGGQLLHNWAPIGWLEHAINNGRQSAKNWELIYGRKRRKTRKKRFKRP